MLDMPPGCNLFDLVPVLVALFHLFASIFPSTFRAGSLDKLPLDSDFNCNARSVFFFVFEITESRRDPASHDQVAEPLGAQTEPSRLLFPTIS